MADRVQDKDIHMGTVTDLGTVRGEGQLTGMAQRTTSTYPELRDSHPDALIALAVIALVLCAGTVGLRFGRKVKTPER